MLLYLTFWCIKVSILAPEFLEYFLLPITLLRLLFSDSNLLLLHPHLVILFKLRYLRLILYQCIVFYQISPRIQFLQEFKHLAVPPLGIVRILQYLHHIATYIPHLLLPLFIQVLCLLILL